MIISLGYRIKSKVTTNFRRKAKDEYKKYQVKTISPVEKEYLETLRVISNKIDDKAKAE
jgi:hypothetical protein